MGPRKTVFNSNWLKVYSWISSVDGNDSKAFCKICKKAFSISSRGVASIKEHSEGDKHKSAEKSTTLAQPLQRFFTRTSKFNLF